ncbi:hypothetical protein BU25DRAFT_451096 [Macroventuria anomochaeta]|uniref:Uncharacterized protein n=1 Tax=Macroventuria anomochaeta TaxID=301207 RepID=A0ACB6RPD3_9PLEO|nr:uncharacterized protein BU25DRAFT_451096 [Macroventuria anomochaeta]KAF2623901.1 hypothetical protein BU25DRAFT_451096 [Macroventuria anomochaeta]
MQVVGPELHPVLPIFPLDAESNAQISVIAQFDSRESSIDVTAKHWMVIESSNVNAGLRRRLGPADDYVANHSFFCHAGYFDKDVDVSNKVLHRDSEYGAGAVEREELGADRTTQLRETHKLTVPSICIRYMFVGFRVGVATLLEQV